MDPHGWAMVVGPQDLGPKVEVHNARDRKLQYRVGDSASFSFVLDGRDPVWEWITELATDVWVYRNNKLFFRGRIGPTVDNLDEESNVVTGNAFDYREWLGRQILSPSAILSWVNVPRAQIIQDMLDDLDSQPGIKPFIGLDASRLSTTPTNFDLLPGSTIKDAIAAMTGFGWQVVPSGSGFEDPGNLDLKAVSPFYYVLNDYFVMEYGGVVAKISRQLNTAGFANTAFVSGDMALTVPEVRAKSDILTDKRGPLGVAVSDPQIIDQSALVSRANEEIAARDEVAASWKCELVKGAWINEDDAWLGDIVRFVVNDGRLKVNDFYRITDFDVALSDDGQDQAVSMTMTRPPFVPTQEMTARTLEEVRYGFVT
jgi:hypothetical protein